jgi:2-polyprenyl-6-methoxyphenol hydroxylase-like FAD-dependent oxidoreductase
MKLLPALLLATLAAVTPLTAADSYDIVVYGGSSGGITAAIQAARMGKTAVLIEPTKFLGGLTTGGLGATDIGNKKAIGGISREFYATSSILRRSREVEAADPRGILRQEARTATPAPRRPCGPSSRMSPRRSTTPCSPR